MVNERLIRICLIATCIIMGTGASYFLKFDQQGIIDGEEEDIDDQCGSVGNEDKEQESDYIEASSNKLEKMDEKIEIFEMPKV